jgi:hypothetical protein
LLFFELLISEGTRASQTNRIGAIAFFFVGFRERQRRKYIKHGSCSRRGRRWGRLVAGRGRWRGVTRRRRGWRAASSSIVHRSHARWRRGSAHARRSSTGSSHTRRSSRITTVSTVSIGRLAARRSRLLPRIGSGGGRTRSSISALRWVAVVAVLCSPRGRATLAATSIVVARAIVATRLVVVAGTVVAASLLPGSHIALGRRSTLLPGLRIAVVRVAALFGTGFNATGLVLATCATRQFVHELLEIMLVPSVR